MKSFRQLREEIQLEATWASGGRSRYTNAIKRGNNSSKEKIDWEAKGDNITHKVVTNPDTKEQEHEFAGNGSRVRVKHKDLKDFINNPTGSIKRVLDRGNAVVSNGHYVAGEFNPEKLHKIFSENIKQESQTESLEDDLLKIPGAKIRPPKPNRPAPVGSTVVPADGRHDAVSRGVVDSRKKYKND